MGPNPPRGLRAGVFSVLVWLALSIWLAVLAGRLFGWMSGAPAVGMAAMTVTAVGLLVWGWTRLQRPTTPDFFERFEAQGWFTAERYKPTQGLRVRRATMLGLLVLLGSGVWVLHNHGSLLSATKDWVLTIPYFNVQIPILPDVAITLPIILAAAAFWFSYRLVNWPVFADFLIATEAEVNKISWASRKSVIQDTIVVLVTVLLFTIFLFIVDLLWGYILGSRFVGVLRLNPNQPAATNQAEQIDW
jgi:preprotein translocase SecE subunit